MTESPNPDPDLAAPRTANRWVEAEGTVRSSVRDNDGRLTLNIVSAGGRFQARLATLDAALGDAFVDSKVRVQGVANTTFNVSGQAVGLRILVPSLQHVAVREAHVADPFSLAVQPIRSLKSPVAGEDPGHRVRIQGIVSTRDDGTTVVSDETGRVIIRADSMPGLQSGGRIDVLGYPVAEGSVLTLEDAVFRPIGDVPSTSSADATPRATPERSAAMPVIATIDAIRHLPPVEAARAYQVHLHAVITTGDATSVFIQDATAGIYVPMTRGRHSNEAFVAVRATPTPRRSFRRRYDRDRTKRL